jgi:hypothetical protein
MNLAQLVEALYEQTHKLATQLDAQVASDVKDLWEQAKAFKVTVPAAPAAPATDQK